MFEYVQRGFALIKVNARYGRDIDRPVDLATTPVYVRAGAVIPMGPVKQYNEQRVTFTGRPLTAKLSR